MQVEVDDLKFLKRHTIRKVKEETALDYAAAVNEEIRDLFAAGADVVQIDEPCMQARPAETEEHGLDELNRTLDGVEGTTAVQPRCFGENSPVHELSSQAPDL